jgi:hypothetical protein
MTVAARGNCTDGGTRDSTACAKRHSFRDGAD